MYNSFMKTITIKLKRLGKKRVKLFEFTLNAQVETLKALITQTVINEVTRFNEKQENPLIVPFLTAKEIKIEEKQGKVSFGDRQNRIKADKDDAIENAILAFEDGIFVVFIDDEEIKALDTKIEVTEKSEIVFMRLTFLTGTYW